MNSSGHEPQAQERDVYQVDHNSLLYIIPEMGALSVTHRPQGLGKLHSIETPYRFVISAHGVEKINETLLSVHLICNRVYHPGKLREQRPLHGSTP